MAGGVTLECAACGKRWTVMPKPGGAMPAGSRCPRHLGGCGRLRKLPRTTPGTGAAVTSAGGGEWNPPSGPRGDREIAGRCSDCHQPVTTSPRGTALWCTGCGSAVIPPGVQAPYARGGTAARKVKSQRETDLEALGLAGRKGTMLGQLRALADSGRLDDASRLKTEWFADEVKAARSGARLDALAGLFAEAGIRPRRIWQPRPAITNGYAADGYDDEDEEVPGGEIAEEVQGDEPAAVQAIAAAPRRPALAEALTACGWQLAPPYGGCQILDEHGQRCAGGTGRPPVNDALGRPVWFCGHHYVAVDKIMNGISRRPA